MPEGDDFRDLDLVLAEPGSPVDITFRGVATNRGRITDLVIKPIEDAVPEARKFTQKWIRLGLMEMKEDARRELSANLLALIPDDEHAEFRRAVISETRATPTTSAGGFQHAAGTHQPPRRRRDLRLPLHARRASLELAGGLTRRRDRRSQGARPALFRADRDGAAARRPERARAGPASLHAAIPAHRRRGDRGVRAGCPRAGGWNEQPKFSSVRSRGPAFAGRRSHLDLASLRPCAHVGCGDRI